MSPDKGLRFGEPENGLGVNDGRLHTTILLISRPGANARRCGARNRMNLRRGSRRQKRKSSLRGSPSGQRQCQPSSCSSVTGPSCTPARASAAALPGLISLSGASGTLTAICIRLRFFFGGVGADAGFSFSARTSDLLILRGN